LINFCFRSLEYKALIKLVLKVTISILMILTLMLYKHKQSITG